MRRPLRRSRDGAAPPADATVPNADATAADGLPELAAWLEGPPRSTPEAVGSRAAVPVAAAASDPPDEPVPTAAVPPALVALPAPPGPSAAARSALRIRPSVPFTMRRRRRSRGGPLVVASAFLAGFIGIAFAIGWLVGRMLL